MLIQDTTKWWEDVFQSKFVNFCKKSPILLSMSLRAYKDERGVLITHINSDSKYFFPFTYKKHPKDFIASIKKLLVSKHYPRIVEEILERHELTPDELAKKIEDGHSHNGLSKYEMRVVGKRMYRIDKILAWKQIAILALEDSTFENDEIGESFRYKFNGGSLVIFLKNYRSNKFKTVEEASAYFLQNSLLIDKIVAKEDIGKTNTN